MGDRAEMPAIRPGTSVRVVVAGLGLAGLPSTGAQRQACAAGIGIDFNQARALVTEVKIVAHHDGGVTGAKTRAFRQIRRDLLPICRAVQQFPADFQQFEHLPEVGSLEGDT